ncbi:vWA domain-containing protein [uncultured Phenylobacterium sp.]|uniref:vWA domain-containing protein n=1 Tax=uncultured Phenylobacterium sp. TaxID=349273 RepID=UPI0025FEFE8E|nr:vWA domain-containing protein [uncultured Phenylobacterium sp.]
MSPSRPSRRNRFLRAICDRRGNVATVAALAMAPLAIAGLGAADLARATSAKSQLQDALDAAALAAARSNATTDSELKVAGDKYLNQNLALGSAFALTSSTFKFGADGRVVAAAKLRVTPFVVGLVTGGSMDVGASAEVVRAGSKLEIALVLDNTGSMDQGDKLEDMKEAAENFVDKMEELSDKATELNTIRISLVPFSNSVRLDATAHRYSSWIDQSGNSPINDEIFTTATGTQHANRFDLFAQLGTSWRGCVEMRKAPYDVQDDAPTSGAMLYTPYFAVDEPDSQTSGYGDDYQNDYVSDGVSGSVTNWRVRQGKVNKYGGSKKGSMTTTFGPNRGCQLKPLRRLGTDFSGLRSAINDLNAAGNTNIPIGMAWGWNTLSPHAPFSDGVAYGTVGYKKIIVLMTDGENTIDQRDTPNDGTYAGTGYIWQGRILKADGAPLPQGASDADRTAALDSRLALICTNIKARGIEVYTIRVEDGSSTLLKNCASGDDHYYNVEDSVTLTAAFESIAGQIAALHLAK